VDGEARFEELRDDLLARNDDLERTKMTGTPSLARCVELVAGLTAAGEATVIGLSDAGARERALAPDGAHLFDPDGHGRPTKELVVVPPAHAARRAGLAEAALA
jgi:hypothetical protein